MTVKEYNKEFLPQVNGAKTLVSALGDVIENGISDKETHGK
jgi:hypothetical protein